MFRRAVAAAVAVISIPVLSLPAGALGATAGAKVYFRNLNTNAVKPPVLFFAFDNGPRMVDIHWYGWGTDRAVGYGAWMARNVGSVGEDELDVRPARVILTQPKACGGNPTTVPTLPRSARFYSGFELITWDGNYKKHVERGHGC